MSDCPNYYLLADGREFAEYLEKDATKALTSFVVENEIPWPSWYVSHCLFSAMEHRFRLGRKEGEAETDAIAASWWFTQAEQAYLKMTRSHESNLHATAIISLMKLLVDQERDKLATAE